MIPKRSLSRFYGERVLPREMVYSRLILTLLIAVAPVLSASQEDPKFDALMAEALALKPASVDLASGADAWTIRVVRTGGIAGTLLDVTVNSEGKLKCVSSDSKVCVEALSPDVLEATSRLAVSKNISERKSTLSASCRDCFVTRITVRRREEGGKAKTYFAYWDDLTATSAPFDLVRLATAVVALTE